MNIITQNHVNVFVFKQNMIVSEMMLITSLSYVYSKIKKGSYQSIICYCL